MLNLTKPKQFEQDFDNEFTNYKIIIDEIENMYPNYRLNQKDKNLSNELASNNSNLTNSQSRLFSLKNNLENNTLKLREHNDNMINEINELDHEIARLQERYDNLLNSNNAAKYALLDFRFSYNEKLIYNIILGIVIFSAIFINYKRKPLTK
jgi:chromosome segregation ATPase